MFAQARSKLKRCRTPREIVEQRIERRLKSRIISRPRIGTFKFLEWRDKRFWNVAASGRAETPTSVGHRLWSGTHFCSASVVLTAAISAMILAGSFLPG